MHGVSAETVFLLKIMVVMNISKLLSRVRHYIQGFFEIAVAKTPRYHFVIEKFEITYQSTTIKTRVHYTPIGCYRPFKNFPSEINDELVCRKFKPDHARMIIGIDTLEKNLDFKCKKQTKIYMTFVTACMQHVTGG